MPKKQRHTAQRIFQRLRYEYGFEGQYTIVKDYLREHRRRTREMFVPLFHPPGHAQCDFGEALVVTGGVERKAHCFVLDLTHDDGCFIKAYPAETTEGLPGRPRVGLRLPRWRAPEHPLRQYEAGRGEDTGRRMPPAHPGLHRAPVPLPVRGPIRPARQGQRQGTVEGLVGYMRRNFLVPIPSFESFSALNGYLERRCLERMDARLRGHTETIGQRMERDLEALLPLPAIEGLLSTAILE